MTSGKIGSDHVIAFQRMFSIAKAQRSVRVSSRSRSSVYPAFADFAKVSPHVGAIDKLRKGSSRLRRADITLALSFAQKKT